MKPKAASVSPALFMDSEVARQIRQHARSCNKAEVCGVLIGSENGSSVEIEACIAGLNATQAGTHVTFTQDTWEHIYKVKDRDYPEQRIVGWYHSHPGFGVFLSDHDTFIHKNFFGSPRQVAWVYDPHSDEEGCFGWTDGRIERLPKISLVDRRGGEKAEETGKPEPAIQFDGDDLTGREEEGWHEEETRSVSTLQQWTVIILSHLSVMLLGFVLAYYLFPRVMLVPVPIDPQTGQPIELAPEQVPNTESKPRIAPPPQAPNPGTADSPKSDAGVKAKGNNDRRQ
jgi:proteasome lid subunit RPN8/RPN11